VPTDAAWVDMIWKRKPLAYAGFTRLAKTMRDMWRPFMEKIDVKEAGVSSEVPSESILLRPHARAPFHWVDEILDVAAQSDIRLWKIRIATRRADVEVVGYLEFFHIPPAGLVHESPPKVVLVGLDVDRALAIAGQADPDASRVEVRYPRSATVADVLAVVDPLYGRGFRDFSFVQADESSRGCLTESGPSSSSVFVSRWRGPGPRRDIAPMSGAPSEEREYILSTDQRELQRLAEQHEAWAEHGRALFRRAGLKAGQVVLDLGCGPGYTSFALAEVVGPRGEVHACDLSERFLVWLAAEAGRRGHQQVRTHLGPVEELALPSESVDAAYSRWLFCWLSDPLPALQQVARVLRPGGVLALQDYLDWGALRLLPRSASFDRMTKACLRSFAEGGSHIDVAERIPELAAAAGLELVEFEPIARIGRPGSPVWKWHEGFFRSYLPRLVERGAITAEDLEAWNRSWDEHAANAGFVFAPVLCDMVLRKPPAG